MRPTTKPDAPWCVVVAGVSGSGKSTIASELAATTGAQLADGDDFHTADAVAKMRAGHPLSDADRAPWLAAIAAWIDTQKANGRSAVISCSALRRTYRDILATDRPWVQFCLLDVPEDTMRERLTSRPAHFMPPSLLPSQLALLEPLEPDERGVTIDASMSPAEVTSTAQHALGLSM